jgi:hypothetical protein
LGCFFFEREFKEVAAAYNAALPTTELSPEMVAAGYEELSKRFGAFQRFWLLAKGSYTELQNWYKAPASEFLTAYAYLMQEDECARKHQEAKSKK